jgi:hypothetical protein
MAHYEFHYFHADTGIFHGNIVSTDCDEGADGFAQANAPAGHKPIAGHFDHLSQRIDIATGEAVDFQPPRPSPDHQWDADARRWRLSAHAQESHRAREAATARIAQLHSAQHDLVRKLHLAPDEETRAQLRAIDAQIEQARTVLR